MERKWNHPFVWVQIPQTGNVTVPEDYYDRFYTLVGQEPPNYHSACKLLAEALAADTVAPATRRDGPRSLVGGLPFSISLENPDCVVTKQRCLLAR